MMALNFKAKQFSREALNDENRIKDNITMLGTILSSEK